MDRSGVYVSVVSSANPTVERIDDRHQRRGGIVFQFDQSDDVGVHLYDRRYGFVQLTGEFFRAICSATVSISLWAANGCAGVNIREKIQHIETRYPNRSGN